MYMLVLGHVPRVEHAFHKFKSDLHGYPVIEA